MMQWTASSSCVITLGKNVRGFCCNSLAVPEHDDLIRLSLWSRDRSDRPQAVASHITALELHHLSDVLPTRIHLTVPRSFRKAAPIGNSAAPHDVQEWTGFRVTVRNARFWMSPPTTPLAMNN
jgi:hypothetical protein